MSGLYMIKQRLRPRIRFDDFGAHPLREVRHLPLCTPPGLPLRIKFEYSTEIPGQNEIRRGGIRQNEPRVLCRDSRRSERVINFLDAFHMLSEKHRIRFAKHRRNNVIKTGRSVIAPEPHVPLTLHAETKMTVPRQLRECRARKSFDGKRIRQVLQRRGVFAADDMADQSIRFLSAFAVGRVPSEITIAFFGENFGRFVAAVTCTNSRERNRPRTVGEQLPLYLFRRPHFRRFIVKLDRRKGFPDKHDVKTSLTQSRTPPNRIRKQTPRCRLYAG